MGSVMHALRLGYAALFGGVGCDGRGREKWVKAKFGGEVAKESARNEKIAKKSLKAPEPMHTHQRSLCVRIAITWASRPSWNRTRCVRS
ncbi:hypothetical protein PIB30_069561 [Stylosanthes scabra]|uniref:Uncharacterized protein n=1 Tax=Stylosanthes scabra TaxID=79078 RepID=A0ABU6WLM9_9FABA|nr:hypothetical protein [Stylosanthes scabra]